MDYLARLAAAMTLGNVMNQKPFLKLAAHRFIWGYEDQFYNIAKGFLQFQQSNMIEQVGLMSNVSMDFLFHFSIKENKLIW